MHTARFRVIPSTLPRLNQFNVYHYDLILGYITREGDRFRAYAIRTGLAVSNLRSITHATHYLRTGTIPLAAFLHKE